MTTTELFPLAEILRREACPCRHPVEDHLDSGPCQAPGCICQRPPAVADRPKEDWATKGVDRNDDETCRRMGRSARDYQWKFMERVLWHGVLWFTPWNKARRPELEDEWRDCLLLGLEIMQRWQQHPDWFVLSVWDDARDARAVALTEAGYQALCHRNLYDTEPYHGGLIAPGWIVTPAAESSPTP